MAMVRALLLLPLLILAPLGQSEPPKTSEPPKIPAGFHQVKLNGHTFTLPEGFTIEVAADAKLAPRPIVASFDEQGRLYVCDSSGSNEKVAEQLQKKPHRVVRLEDTDGDGKYDKSTVFVKNVMFPEGAMWFNGSLYVAAPPHIMKFTDTDNDGVADKEEIWFDGKTLTGCANDLHGPYLGPDGWIYWCKGAFAKQDYTLANGKKFTTRASHIFRAKPDGSAIEPVMTGGMDNPVDTVFMPSGERIFSTTFFQRPGDGKRDGLIHAIYGGVYGKDHDVAYEHPWTSPHFMPVLTHMGPAAPCGLHRCESDQFGKEYENNVYCCQFNMRKVSRHKLTPEGSTYESKDSDFVVSDNLDFHPTDIIEDADGSMLIVDTGGWYKLCCPTSQLVKPDVTGAIYRVKRTGAHKIDDPRGLKLDWAKATAEQLGERLGDVRPAVRQRAIETFAGRGPSEVKVLTSLLAGPGNSQRRRLAVVAALTRIDSPDAREAVRSLLLNRDAPVCNLAMHSVSLWRDVDASASVISLLRCPAPHTRRVAAEAAGRIGNPKAVPEILKALANESNDRALDHSLTYALIEIGHAEETLKGLSHDSPRVRRATLAALEHIPSSGLPPLSVLAALDAKDPALKETAGWIAGRHPDWSEHLVGYFGDRLKVLDKMTAPEQDEFVARMTPLLKTEAVRKAVGSALAGMTDTTAARAIMRGLARSGLKTLPPEWADGLLLSLHSRDHEAVREAIRVLRSVPPTSALAGDILAQVQSYRKRNNTPLPKELDYELLAVTTAAISQTLAPDIIADTQHDRAGPVRAAAADLLTRASLSKDSLIALAGALKNANPVEVGKLLPAFAKSTDEKVGMAILAGLNEPKVRTAIRIEMIKPILDKYPKSVRDEAEKLYEALAEARKGERDKLEALLKNLPSGDIRRGQIVFNGAKAQCIACHKMGYVGGLNGPDLTRIGGIRNERDLLESIVFPSASFVRSYEPVKVMTASGRSFNGILKKDAPDEVIIALDATKEERIARADVEDISPSSLSIMPAGFDQQLSIQEIADLIAFLKACK
jgi:putative membrane-bound dehydrogenase-like protein